MSEVFVQSPTPVDSGHDGANGGSWTHPTSLAQKERLARFGASQCVDIHCHCLPGLDDGPRTMIEALALCRLLVDDGVTTVIATPHQMGRYEGENSAKSIREAAGALRSALEQEGIPLVVQVGADVRIDQQLGRLLDADQVLTLADGKRYLLLELPHEIYIEPRAILEELLARGICPIMTHPERYSYLQKKPQAIQGWVEQGALVQITAGSLVGDFGPAAHKSAWDLIGKGWVSLVATDAHDSRSRPPRMSAAIEAISQKSCHPVARRLCVENPAAVLEGRAIVGPAVRTKMRTAGQPGGE